MKVFVFLAFLLPITVLAGNGLPDKPYIYVEGQAQVEKPTDVEIVSFSVEATGLDQEKANEAVQSKARKVFELLTTVGIADADIVSSQLKTEPVYESGNEYSQRRGKRVGTSVSRLFEVRVRNLPTVTKLVDDLVAIGGLEITSMDDALSIGPEVLDDLWNKAIQNARERAEKMLGPLGMKIDSVFAVSPIPFPEVPSKMLPPSNGGTVVTGSNLPVRAKHEGKTPEYRFAPVHLDQTIHIIYLISPAK